MAKKTARPARTRRTRTSSRVRRAPKAMRVQDSPSVPSVPPVQPPAPPVEHSMKSIWFMVGLVLTAMGGVIFITGLYDVIDPSDVKTAMGHLKPDLWWGGIMVLAGLTFVLTQRKSSAG